MNASATDNARQPSIPYTTEITSQRAELSEIDQSIRSASLFFTVSAVIWLLLGTVFALIAAIKMHNPEFLAGFEAATFGRVRSAHLNAVALGWSNNVIYGLCLWIMARLCRSPIRHGGLLIIAGVFWNLGVSLTGGSRLRLAMVLSCRFILVSMDLRCRGSDDTLGTRTRRCTIRRQLVVWS